MRKPRTSKVLAKYGDWAVTTYGVECLSQYYPVEKRRLWEGEGGHEWWDHMEETKRWCNVTDFTRALLQARVVHAQSKPKRPT